MQAKGQASALDANTYTNGLLSFISTAFSPRNGIAIGANQINTTMIMARSTRTGLMSSLFFEGMEFISLLLVIFLHFTEKIQGLTFQS
jgi:hypothetical protein